VLFRQAGAERQAEDAPDEDKDGHTDCESAKKEGGRRGDPRA
jgi:hypothetical protein